MDFFMASPDHLRADSRWVPVRNSRLEAASVHCPDQLQGLAANPVELAYLGSMAHLGFLAFLGYQAFQASPGHFPSPYWLRSRTGQLPTETHHLKLEEAAVPMLGTEPKRVLLDISIHHKAERWGPTAPPSDSDQHLNPLARCFWCDGTHFEQSPAVRLRQVRFLLRIDPPAGLGHHGCRSKPWLSSRRCFSTASWRRAV